MNTLSQTVTIPTIFGKFLTTLFALIRVLVHVIIFTLNIIVTICNNN